LANIKSVKKDIRKAEKRRVENSQKKSKIRTIAKKILRSIKEGKKEEASLLFNSFASLVDKAAKINLIHYKKADRDKSRMAKRVHSVKVA
jgi:small subunit ribosomal protein S20